MIYQSQLQAVNFKWLIRANSKLSFTNDSSEPTPQLSFFKWLIRANSHLSLSNDSSEPTPSCHFQMTHYSQLPAVNFRWPIWVTTHLATANPQPAVLPALQLDHSGSWMSPQFESLQMLLDSTDLHACPFSHIPSPTDLCTWVTPGYFDVVYSVQHVLIIIKNQLHVHTNI